MTKFKKYEVITILKMFKEQGCITIEDVIQLLNKELKNDNDIVVTKEFGG